MGLFLDELLHDRFPVSEIDHTLFEELILFEQNVIYVTLVGLYEYFMAFLGNFLDKWGEEVGDELMLYVMNIVSIELFQFRDNGFHDVLDRIVATFLVVSEPDYVFYHLEHELAQSNDAIKFNMVLNLFTSRLSS